MKIDEYIIGLRKNHGIGISLENGELKVRAAQEALTKEIVEVIKARKSEIIAFFESVSENDTDRTIPLATQSDYYKCSSAQKRLHFIHELDKTSLAYNLPVFMKLEGQLDLNKLTEALNQLVHRHESLRTSFKIVDEEVHQVIADEENVRIELFQSSENEVQSTIEKFNRPFDLAQGPLIRVGLIKISSLESVLMVDMHHIICDGMSQGILIRDFMALYSDELIPALTFQYKDYVAWQGTEAQQKATVRYKDFWLKEFSEEIDSLDLPTDFTRPPIKNYEGSSVHFEISQEKTLELKRLADGEDTTMFTLLLSLYYVLLGKLTNEEDITIGTPIAGRQHADLENIMGMFVNTLPLRNYPRNKSGFTDFLSEVKTRVLTCFDNQSVQYEELIRELKLERVTNRNPLFDVMFVFENFEEVALKIPGLKLEQLNRERIESKFDLTLTAKESDGKILLNFEYATQLFKEETIRRFVTYFEEIVSVVTREPKKQIAAIEILTGLEREQLLSTFNDTQRQYPDKQTVVSLFETQAQNSPNKPALFFEDLTLSYGELKIQSDKIAQYLAQVKQIKTGDTVGVMLHREIWLVPVIYGILKAGGVYVPIDPKFPADRINTIIEASGLKALITRTIHVQDLDIEEALCVDLDQVENEILMQPALAPEVNLTSRDLAYVIYTSGSTGKPKGVMIEHRSVVNRLLWMQKEYPIDENDTLLQKTPIVFDVSVWELFWWSFTGASLCLLKPEEEKEPEDIIKAIARHNITTIHFVPSMLSTFLSVLPKDYDIDRLSSLKQVFTSGEALKAEHVHEFREVINKQNGARLINLYGPTEATVDVSFYECDLNQTEINPPIGQPIDNTTLYILGKDNQLLPVGVPGELHIGGVGVARGYLGDPEQTHEKFITDPITGDGRVYKTGDLVKWLPDGNIGYLGRIDHQVKIKGFRIELGEIESHLLTHNLIQEVAVVDREEQGDKFLVAYYVSEKVIDVMALRSHLSEKLPGYMIPSYFVHLVTLPLTSNGKLNRKSLPAPEIKAGEDHATPETKEEQLLAEVWSAVLGVEGIGAVDNFFAVGGDSIKSIQISSRMRDAGYEVSVQDIFDYQTIRQLAKKLKVLNTLSDQSIIEGTTTLSPIQRWFFEGTVKDRHHYNQSVLLNFPDGLSKKEVTLIFEQLLATHDALRMVFVKDQNTWSQVNRGAVSPVSIVERDLRAETEAQKELLKTSNEIQSSIDLTNGPLMKLGLFHRQDGSRLLIVIHHLVVDGVSWRILFEDIEHLHHQLLNHEELSLPLKTDPFLSWPSRLQEYSEGSTFKIAKQYWDDFSLQGLIPLERDHPLEQSRNQDSQQVSFQLNKEETSQLLTEVHSSFNTQINDILLTALLLGVQREYGHDRVAVDLEGHGREPMHQHVNVSRTVGWFTSIYPVLLRSSEEDLASTIKQVKEYLRSVPNRGIDYLLYQSLNHEPLETTSKSQILFNYLGQFDTDIKGKSFSLSDEPQGSPRSPDDLLEYDWSISGFISQGQLKMTLDYGSKQYDEATIVSFMHHYEEGLREIIHYCQGRVNTELTPSDLTYKELSLAQLATLQSRYELEDVYPLSSMQEGILFHSLLDMEAGDYFGQTTYQIQGNLNISVVEESMNELMARYAILRTVFLHQSYARPVQVVLKERKIDFAYENLRHASFSDSRQATLLAYREEEKSKTFDLSNDVLMRLLVLETGDNEFELIWSHHHVLMDGWCIGVLVNEFAWIYARKLQNKSTLLKPTTPYSTYIQWLENRPKQAAKEYWQNYLSSFNASVTIPKKQALDATGAHYLLKRQHTIFNSEETKGLEEFSRKNGVTTNTVLQCAWGLLLAKYNNVNDVVFGTVVSGRPVEIQGVETMVGLFINTIPTRVSYDPQESVADFLIKTQAESIKSGPHHYYPLSEIQALSELGGDLINHIIAFENFPASKQLVNLGHEAEEEEMPFEIKSSDYWVQTNYDLSITVVPSDELEVILDYNSNKYDDPIIADLCVYLKNIILSFVENRDTLLRDISLFKVEEQETIRQKLSSSLEVSTDFSTIQERLNHSFKTNSLSTAIEYKGKKYTYEALESTAKKIAHAIDLCQLPVGSNIGILCKDRSHLICAILGILKARMAFVPLEATLPENRLASMINQTSTKLIITDQELRVRDQFNSSDSTIQWLTFDDLDQQSEVSFDIQKTYQPDDHIYVYFTSGSTGKPKGVIGRNTGLSHFIGWEIEAFGIDKSFRVSQFTNPGFDVFMRDIFVPLCAGATICIPAENILSLDQPIHAWIAEQRITLIHCVPSLFKLIQKEVGNVNSFSELKYILLAGEKILPWELKEWYDTFDQTVSLVNIYGPTETTLAKGSYTIQRSDTNRSFVPIKAISGAQFLLLDDSLNVCPKGAIGEIYIRTPYKSAGYIGLSETNQKSFIRNPYSDDEDDLIYKTGDLGKEHENGEIEILGRLDNQVKIRGIRIELDDIKENICKYQGITDAVVVVKEDADAEKFIAAYLLSEEPFDSTELRAYLDTALPPNMVPAYLISVPEFPLMPNGKINRKALPDPVIEQEESQEPAANPTEEKLLDIWTEVLKVDKDVISVTKSFFEMGGHSVKVFHIINRIQQEFSVKLKLAQVFQNASVREIAKLISGSEQDDAVQIPRAAQREFYKASAAQERMYFQHLLHKESTAFNISIPIEVKGELNIDKLNESFQKLVDRHESLRTSFMLTNDGVTQKINEDLTFQIEILQSNDTVLVSDRFNSFIRPFDLTLKCLIRCGVLQHASGNFLFVDIHHIVSDGSSLEILINDFKKIHFGEELHPLKLRYVDYACWLNENKDKLHKQETFWSKKLQGELPRTDLPMMQEREEVDTKIVDFRELEITDEVYRDIKTLTANYKVSDFMLLISAYYILLHKMSGDSDLIIGTEVLGRAQTELKDIVGTFVNILPLRVEATPEKNYVDFLDEVKESVLEAFEHQDFQFDQIVSLANQEGEDTSRNPIFDFYFSFSNTVDGETELDKLEFIPLNLDKQVKGEYEFSLNVVEYNEKMTISFIYSSELYDSETIELLMDYYQNILMDILKNQTLRIEDINMENIVDQML